MQRYTQTAFKCDPFNNYQHLASFWLSKNKSVVCWLEQRKMFEDQYKNTTLCLHFKCQTRRFLCFSFFLSCHLLKKHFKILFKHINTASHCFKNQILMKWLQMPSHTVRVTKATLRMSFQCLICFLSLFRWSSTMIFCKALKVYRSYPSYPSSGSAPFLH